MFKDADLRLQVRFFRVYTVAVVIHMFQVMKELLQ